jgi:Putative serine esterase (DUF676)
MLEDVFELFVHLHDVSNLELLRKGLYRLEIQVNYGTIEGTPISSFAAPSQLTSTSRGFECADSEAGAENGGIDEQSYISRAVHMRYTDEVFDLNEACHFRLSIPKSAISKQGLDEISLSITLSRADFGVPQNSTKANDVYSFVRLSPFSPVCTRTIPVPFRPSFALQSTTTSSSKLLTPTPPIGLFLPVVFDPSFLALATLSVHLQLVSCKFSAPKGPRLHLKDKPVVEKDAPSSSSFTVDETDAGSLEAVGSALLQYASEAEAESSARSKSASTSGSAAPTLNNSSSTSTSTKISNWFSNAFRRRSTSVSAPTVHETVGVRDVDPVTGLPTTTGAPITTVTKAMLAYLNQPFSLAEALFSSELSSGVSTRVNLATYASEIAAEKLAMMSELDVDGSVAPSTPISASPSSPAPSLLVLTKQRSQPQSEGHPISSISLPSSVVPVPTVTKKLRCLTAADMQQAHFLVLHPLVEAYRALAVHVDELLALKRTSKARSDGSFRFPKDIRGRARALVRSHSTAAALSSPTPGMLSAIDISGLVSQTIYPPSDASIGSESSATLFSCSEMDGFGIAATSTSTADDGKRSFAFRARMLASNPAACAEAVFAEASALSAQLYQLWRRLVRVSIGDADSIEPVSAAGASASGNSLITYPRPMPMSPSLRSQSHWAHLDELQCAYAVSALEQVREAVHFKRSSWKALFVESEAWYEDDHGDTPPRSVTSQLRIAVDPVIASFKEEVDVKVWKYSRHSKSGKIGEHKNAKIERQAHISLDDLSESAEGEKKEGGEGTSGSSITTAPTSVATADPTSLERIAASMDIFEQQFIGLELDSPKPLRDPKPPSLSKASGHRKLSFEKEPSLNSDESNVSDPGSPFRSQEAGPTHIVFFLNGFGGTVHDTRVIRTYLKTYYPHVYCYALTKNQGKASEGDLIDTGVRIAEEIYEFLSEDNLTRECLTLGKISFVAFSIGGIVLRLALRHKTIKPFWPRFHTFITVASPHLGHLYASSMLLSTGMFVMQKMRNAVSLTQLTYADEAAPVSPSSANEASQPLVGKRDCLFYLLAVGWRESLPRPEAEARPNMHRLITQGFDGMQNHVLLSLFKHVRLLACPKIDGFTPLSSGLVSWSNAALNDPKVSLFYREMLLGFWGDPASSSSAADITHAHAHHHLSHSHHRPSHQSHQHQHQHHSSSSHEVPELDICRVAITFKNLASQSTRFSVTLDSFLQREAHIAFLEKEAIGVLIALGLETENSGPLWE